MRRVRACEPTKQKFRSRQRLRKSGRSSPIAPGQKIKVFAKISPGRAFPVTVTTFEPMREEFSGPLLPLFGSQIPDLTANFAEFAGALKAAAES